MQNEIGDTIYETPVTIKRQVISKETSDIMRYTI